MKSINANGVTGILMHSGNSLLFRVYDSLGGYIDYDVIHSDLQVTINDEDAHFYVGPKRQILDHSPDTLGYK